MGFEEVWYFIPEHKRILELLIDEKNLSSPYAVSKVHEDFLIRNYYHAYGLKHSVVIQLQILELTLSQREPGLLSRASS